MATTTRFLMTKLELGVGQQVTRINEVLDIIDKGMGGYLSKSVAGSVDVTLTASEWENKMFNFTGAITANISVIVPATTRKFLVLNNTSGAFTLTVKVSGQTGVVVPQGSKKGLGNNGTDVFDATEASALSNDSVTFAIMQNITTDRLLGRDTTGTGDVEEISVTGGLEFTGSGGIQRSALTGDVTASAGSNSLTIANDAVTYAKLQNISATSRILARKTSGAGDAEETTLSEVLDFIGSAAQGDILYRGASAWARLPAGTNGQVLQTQGTGANPQWASAGGSTQGRHTIWIPASAMTPALTNGATANQIELSSNKNNHRVMEFPDGANAKYTHFNVEFPKAWNKSTVTYNVSWTLNSTSTNSAVFGLQGVAISNDDPLDVAYGTAVTVTDAGLGTARDFHRSAESSALTIAGTPANDDMVEFRFFRDPANGSDNLTSVTAEVLGVTIFYTTNADTDA